MTQIDEISNLTPIQEFYSGTNIFITGGTGFLGTILIEKLLRSCNDISTIYILARNKKGKNLQSRIDELFDDSIFDRLKKEFPKFRHKVVGIGGDCSLPDLGISQQDRQVLINEVSVIFHVAATVRFDEKLKMAVAINVRAPQDMLKLAHEMPHLKSMVHVSTAYSNVPNKVIEERLYPVPVDSKKLILMAETLGDNVLDNITPMVLDKWPNTYTYTKAVAEDIVRQDGLDLPIGIYRPSIVVSTYQEPTEAWINNLYGPTGVCAGAGSGILRALHANSEVNANIVPVDMCVNSLIATAWDVGVKFENSKKSCNKYEIPVYHFESSNDQPLNWGRFMRLSYSHGKKTPSVKAIWYYTFNLYKNYYAYLIATIFLHYLPALFVDGALLCMGKSPKMLRIYKKIHKFTSVISYFSTRTWIFQSSNVQKMIERMSEADQKIFFCDLKKLDWNKFFATYLRGIRIYLLQDPIETLEEAHIRWNRLYWLHQGVKALVAFLLIRVLWWILSTVFIY
ncbi:fatty acyl-CoA reductase wat [Tribolium castaneum]|uniref:Fatty acyl-CoA reductase n=1 Tax=Tribolium castaneum TaxID=7070 RepID=D2A5T7_TRICA|nr:PREDICTED: putative fatty acyl-CoA reductase CG5065 [Tribolium castaneum]EFA05024.1 Putative fatty acyl-CoA reductase CG5065-like Protein [Tribolium castaneum]|eukprot:XP_966905.1 PREDICTED: putative fatty acyl-CoA reductase CG5065 [Tribolium castaneum]